MVCPVYIHEPWVGGADPAGRAIVLMNDAFIKTGDLDKIDGVIINGASNYQFDHGLDSFMTARGFMKVINPNFGVEKERWRFSSICCIFIKRKLNPEQVTYPDNELKYRVAACRIGDLTIRGISVPQSYTEVQAIREKFLNRKNSFLDCELKLEKDENNTDSKTLVIGDMNTSPEELDLPFTALITEPTWNGKTLDNVLISKALDGKVTASVINFRIGVTSDHSIIVANVDA